jgi:hypothetical protein
MNLIYIHMIGLMGLIGALVACVDMGRLLFSGFINSCGMCLSYGQMICGEFGEYAMVFVYQCLDMLF